MELNVLIPLVFAVVFLMIDIAMLIRMIYLLKKSKDDTVENLGKKLRASLKTRLIKEKTDRCGSCKESFRRRAFALQGRLTKQMSCIAVFSQKGFLEMPYIGVIAH